MILVILTVNRDFTAVDGLRRQQVLHVLYMIGSVDIIIVATVLLPSTVDHAKTIVIRTKDCTNTNIENNLKIEPRHENTGFLAHLSRRLIGELIVYPWSGVRRPSVVRSQCSNIFFSETAWPIKAKFYVEPPWVGGTIFCSRHLGLLL